MPLIKPEAVNYDKDNKLSCLYFGEDSVAPSGKYSMKGGISFPTKTDEGISGFVILTGMNVDTGKIYIFEEKQFVCIDHIVNEEGLIDYYGISTWFNEVWAKYFGNYYFWNQEYETNKKYLLQVLRSKMINPNPIFMEVDWQDESQASQTIFEKEMVGKLFYSKDGTVFEQMQRFNGDPDKFYPAIHALKCCLVGIDRYPVRLKVIY